MNENANKTNSWKAQIKKQNMILLWWSSAWVLTMAIATFGPKAIWYSNKSLTIFAIIVNTVIGFGMILANKDHLKLLDEMQQKIQLDAMAITLGLGLVVGLSFSVLDTTNIISYDAEISYLIIFMGLTYLTATFVSHYKYR